MLKKRYISGGKVCKVTFLLLPRMGAQAVALVGEFNRWDRTAMPMTPLRDGRWKAEVNLAAGSEYQFRYLIDGEEWHNDPEADGYIGHPFGSENSVVTT